MITNFNEARPAKSDLYKAFMYSCILDSAWNYERQQSLMYCYSMIPMLKRLYGNDEEKMADALYRHLEFTSYAPHLVTLLMGVTGVTKEENTKDGNFDTVSISAVKASLMGPMTRIGDVLFWGTLLTIATGVSVSSTKQGSITGPITFLSIINIPDFLARYYCLHAGSKYGVELSGDGENSRMIEDITKVASIPGLTVIGAMIASTVNINIPLEIDVEDVKGPIQTHIDQIMPCLLPLTVFGIVYWPLGKSVKTTAILVCLIILACIETSFNLL